MAAEQYVRTQSEITAFSRLKSARSCLLWYVPVWQARQPALLVFTGVNATRSALSFASASFPWIPVSHKHEAHVTSEVTSCQDWLEQTLSAELQQQQL